MDQSFLQHTTVAAVTSWLTALAVATPLIGLLAGAAVGLRRRALARWCLVGLLGGASGPLLLGGWQLVVGRTTFHDRRYARDGQTRHPLWALHPPARYYESRDAARSGPTDPLLRDQSPLPRTLSTHRPRWGLVPADRLDSVANLAVLAVAFAAGGLGLGLAWAWALRRLPAGAGDGER